MERYLNLHCFTEHSSFQASIILNWYDDEEKKTNSENKQQTNAIECRNSISGLEAPSQHQDGAVPMLLSPACKKALLAAIQITQNCAPVNCTDL